MRKFGYLLAGAACLLPTLAGAQTKFTGTCICKADAQHMLPVGDRVGHSLGAEQYKCSWTKPIELAGEKTKDGVATDTVEANGTKMRFRGVHVVTTEAGDKVALPYRGSGESRGDKEAHSTGSFAIADGTGKLAGLKGTGTFRCDSGENGLTCNVEGQYEAAK